MKILQILPELNFGGVETGTVDISKELLRLGHQPYVVSAGGEKVKMLHKMGIPHFKLPVNKKSLRALTAVPEIAEIIRREKIDIVHVRSRVPALVGYLATRKTDAIYITSCHGHYADHLLSRIMGWGKYVIVVSNSIGRRMLDTFNVPPERIKLVHRGLDIERYTYNLNRFSEEKLKKKERFVIANIARITPLKGHRYFLQAIRRAKMSIANIEVWLIGSSSKKKRYREELEVLIEKFGLKDSVKFLGSRDDIPKLLQEIDLVVLSTTTPEGFGRVLIEAGASGVPVISTRVGGILDVIEHKKDGILVPPSDPIEMSKAIVDVLENYPAYQVMAESFRKKIESEFTLQKMALETVNVYEEALQKKRILVIKFGALGDLVLIVPSLRAIREKYPHAHISLLVDGKLAPLLEQCPYINEVLTCRRDKGKGYYKRFISLAMKLRRAAFDISIDFQNNKWTHVLAYLADIRRRFGYKRGMFGELLTNGIPLGKENILPVQHQLQVLNLMGIRSIEERLELWSSDEDAAGIERMLSQSWTEPNQALVGFVLNASLHWRTKRWPLSLFVELAERLQSELKVRVVLIGDASNKRYAEQFLLQTETDTVDLVGKTSIREMIALISRLDCLVSGDTAPIHVASAVNTKTVALFGPTDPRRHVPPGGECVVIKRNLSCMPCYKRTCRHINCMKQITVEEVFQAVQRCLAAKTVKA
ncbi:MAG: lipopolysaccharide heptosyltransferase II [Candidatus Omnitrophica bacterium]|nr:lipopolysaccharide heptosyltransferase II [Candidatus Omnitrophota bacterium]